MERKLKARAVLTTKRHAPHTHNLIRLAKLANLKLNPDETNLLADVNNFNLEARYPNEKLEFYKKATKSFTDKYYESVINFFKKYE